MIRVSEAVLPGHPDKLCDFVAESHSAGGARRGPGGVRADRGCNLVRPAVAVGRVRGARAGARRGAHRGGGARFDRAGRGPRREARPVAGDQLRLPLRGGPDALDAPRQRPGDRDRLGRLRRQGAVPATRALPGAGVPHRAVGGVPGRRTRALRARRQADRAPARGSPMGSRSSTCW